MPAKNEDVDFSWNLKEFYPFALAQSFFFFNCSSVLFLSLSVLFFSLPLIRSNFGVALILFDLASFYFSFALADAK